MRATCLGLHEDLGTRTKICQFKQVIKITNLRDPPLEGPVHGIHNVMKWLLIFPFY